MPLELHQLHFSYESSSNPSPVIKNLSATLKPNQLTAIIGPNAAGKSTLLRLMLGQLIPTAGQIHFQNQPNTNTKINIHQLDPKQIARRISYVPQRGEIAFGFTVTQVVSMGLYAHTPNTNSFTPQIEATLDRFDLTELADRSYTQLSGGQQQRVILARAHLQNQANLSASSNTLSTLMLLDEPVSAMDLRHAHSTMAHLKQLTQHSTDPTTVVVVLHDLNLVAQYADQVWLLDQGQLQPQHQGPTSQVMQPDRLSPIYQINLTRIEPPDQTHPPIFYVNPSTRDRND